jgi:hypothetical protein
MLYQCAVFQRLLAALHTKLPPKLITNPPNVAAASSNRVFVPPQSQSSSSSDLKSTKLPRGKYLGTAVPGHPAASASCTNKSPVAPQRALT